MHHCQIADSLIMQNWSVCPKEIIWKSTFLVLIHAFECKFLVFLVFEAIQLAEQVKVGFELFRGETILRVPLLALVCEIAQLPVKDVIEASTQTEQISDYVAD